MYDEGSFVVTRDNFVVDRAFDFVTLHRHRNHLGHWFTDTRSLVYCRVGTAATGSRRIDGDPSSRHDGSRLRAVNAPLSAPAPERESIPCLRAGACGG